LLKLIGSLLQEINSFVNPNTLWKSVKDIKIAKKAKEYTFIALRT
jgi:hypothetical protein